MSSAVAEVIPPTVVLAGKVSFSGELVVRGTVRGTIATTGNDKLTVAETGLVVASITARNVEISGIVEAKTINCAHTIRVNRTGKIFGATIYFHTLELEEGAVLDNCKLEHKPWPRCGKDGNMGGVIRIPGPDVNTATGYASPNT